jgi:hypothetical protein
LSIYQLIGTDDSKGVIRLADHASIPPDPNNTDWIIYEAWKADGNTAVPASPPTIPTAISAIAFFTRFTGPEQLAIYAAAVANPAIGVGLTMGLAAGSVTLNSPVVVDWIALLVSAGCITPDRSTTILTP